MSQKLLFIFNPHSGKGQIKNNLVEIIDTMVKAVFEVYDRDGKPMALFYTDYFRRP